MSITHVLPDTTLPISGNIDTTFNQLFHLVPPVGPQTYGKVSMPDQRAPITSEMFGDKGNATVWSDVFVQAAHDALVNGGTIRGGSGHYLLQNTVWLKNRVRYVGAGVGHNPQVGGTYFQCSPTFAHTGQPAFKITAGSADASDFMIATDNTDKLNDFIGVQLVHDGAYQPGKSILRNIEVNGCGGGFDFGVGNLVDDYNLRAYNFRRFGHRRGGVSGRNFGPARSYSAVANNGGFTVHTVEATDDDDMIRIDDPANAQIGNEITVDGVNILTIIGKTGDLLMLSGPVTVAINAPVRFAAHLVGTCFEFLGNAADVWLMFAEAAGGRHILHSKGNAGAGWRLPEAITVVEANFTVSCREAMLLERINYFVGTGHVGDAPWSSVVRIAGINADGDPSAACAEGIDLRGCKIAGGGLHGVDWDCGINLEVGDVHSNNLRGGACGNVRRNGAGTDGVFNAVGRNLGNGLYNGSQGLSVASIITDGTFTGTDVIANNHEV